MRLARQEGYANLTKDEVLDKGHAEVLDNLDSIWEDHKEDGWGKFENEEIAGIFVKK